ncbi:hypothetical protein [Lysinibacillus irui]|uniref:hypothetical protein n=1 Tax=Lysinibacillus irui TaxID=2998077 RepID=UPI002AD35310|nr:hypothetical protein [Lysinibacillus irui]MEA0565284.1 hypothetical protein [Lysinibacillus irui]
MNLIFNFFNQGWVGAVIGILGVLIAIYTYKRTKVGPQLVYQWDSLKIIGKNEITPDEITIFYKGTKVPRVIKTTIIIWNSGTKTIEGNNVVRNDPLCLEFSETEEVIGASVLLRTKEVNEFEISTNAEKKNILKVHFEYLDPQDGATIEILHTDNKRYPNFKGTIKGMPKGIMESGNNQSGITGIFSTQPAFVSIMSGNKFSLWTSFILGLVTVAISYLVPYFFKDIKYLKEDFFFTAMLIAGCTYIILPILGLWSSRRKYPKSLNLEKKKE